MSDRLKYLSKNKQMRIQQLTLLLHNCRIYGASEDARKEYLNELKRLEE